MSSCLVSPSPQLPHQIFLKTCTILAKFHPQYTKLFYFVFYPLFSMVWRMLLLFPFILSFFPFCYFLIWDSSTWSFKFPIKMLTIVFYYQSNLSYQETMFKNRVRKSNNHFYEGDWLYYMFNSIKDPERMKKNEYKLTYFMMTILVLLWVINWITK